ncbi:MAG: class I SAM-dependent methyltransferase [Candidatus Eisenbacteria bacterium]
MSERDPLSQYYEAFHSEREKKGTVSAPGRVEWVVKGVGRGNRVLDLGCRSGDLTSHYADGNEVVGVDVDERALGACRDRLGIRTVLHDLSSRLPFGDSEFDVVVLSEVLEHLPYPELTLGEIRRVLRDGGTLVGSVPNGARLRNRLSFLLTGVVEQDRTHLWHYGAASLRRKLETAFSGVEIRPVGGRFLPLLPRMTAKYLLFLCEKEG